MADDTSEHEEVGEEQEDDVDEEVALLSRHRKEKKELQGFASCHCYYIAIASNWFMWL